MLCTKTGTQTVTVKNNSYLGGGTLKFAGTRLTLSQTCANAGKSTVFAYGDRYYRKFNNGACYTRDRVAAPVDWYTAQSSCPSGTSVPTSTQFQSLVNTYGRSLYTVTSGEWHNSGNTDKCHLWSSNTSPSDSSQAWYLELSPTEIAVQWAFGIKSNSVGVDGNWMGLVCIVR